MAKVHSPEVIREQAPYIGAEQVLQDLDREHGLFYISNRSPQVREATEEWLFEICSFPKAPVICIMEDKQQFLSGCQYIIDDRCKTLVQFVYDAEWNTKNPDSSRKGFGLFQQYNQNLTDVPGIYLAPTWSGIRYYLERKGVLNGGNISTSTTTRADQTNADNRILL